ncbi:DUF4330 family protein [Halopiger djelfimassiliensis]|uniref:DUF4330 family protein n=1 Tax=Halopiger djelfimassiliensis TaxID=1293047 RepID=UPI000677888F|nr:DUF4330 family protein [Halopiger djelfimassiliensis]
MPLIDENGNLFGLVNVIDALVVVLGLAVLVAGIAVVSSVGDDPETGETQAAPGEAETRFVTLDLGTQYDYVLDRLEEGDTAAISGTGETVTVTDVYVSPSAPDHANGSVSRATIRAEVDGLARETADRDVFQVAGDPLLLGHELALDLGTYAMTGTITAIDTEEPTLSINETTTDAEIELENVPPAVAAALEENMSETARGETIATITGIERDPASVVLESEGGDIYEREHPRNEDVTLTVELRTVETDTGLEFRGERLEVGTSVALDFGTVTVDGDVTSID